ncbi:MAG: hypothetical protein IPK04_06020 [Bdellovibrionales bacterium]|nr:hypothetical protein [Bdellovibrionales bacterium]
MFEKPSLENVAQAGNEIRSKIKSILSMQKQTESPGRKAAIEVPGALSTAPTEVADAGRELKVKKVLIVDDSKDDSSNLEQDNFRRSGPQGCGRSRKTLTGRSSYC